MLEHNFGLSEKHPEQTDKRNQSKDVCVPSVPHGGHELVPSSVLPPAGHSGHSRLLRPNTCFCALINNRTDRKFVSFQRETLSSFNSDSFSPQTVEQRYRLPVGQPSHRTGSTETRHRYYFLSSKSRLCAYVLLTKQRWFRPAGGFWSALMFESKFYSELPALSTFFFFG